MSTNKLCTSTVSSLSSYSPTSSRSNALISHNPYEILGSVVEARSDGSSLSGSPTSSGGSMSQTGRSGTTALGKPSRGFVSDDSHSALHHGNINDVSPQETRHMFVNTSSVSAVFASPAQNRMPAAAGYSLGSPHKVAMPRRLSANTQSFRSPQGLAQGPRRGSISVQASPYSQNGSGRVSFSSNLRAPTMLHNLNTSSLTGVPEVLAVEEMAFRQGQHDHGVSRDRVPSSPFAKQFDQVWAEFYVLGKACGGTPGASSTVTTSSSHQNFPWPILINPYTQDLERPNGAVDAEWVRKVCTMALNCMAALIHVVCRREGEWRKTICDVPAQIQHALMSFSDLRIRYEELKRDAREAIAGGLPAGY